ncbi:Protein TRANSPARENT TESTA 12 [Hordeum vulgare]|nr:Protein TRANSPARENT TESTA 12 [Hordeum vulgare]
MLATRLPSLSSPLPLSRALSRFLASPSAAPPPKRPHRCTMPLRRRGSSGYLGVRARPSGVYYGEIRSGDVLLGLGTFETVDEAARTYNAAAWLLGRPRAQMNFHNVYKREQAQDVAPPPRLITDQDREDHRWRQRRLLIAEKDERSMAEWRQRHLEDVAPENAFWAERTAWRCEERDDRRRRKALAIS